MILDQVSYIRVLVMSKSPVCLAIPEVYLTEIQFNYTIPYAQELHYVP